MYDLVPDRRICDTLCKRDDFHFRLFERELRLQRIEILCQKSKPYLNSRTNAQGKRQVSLYMWYA